MAKTTKHWYYTQRGERTAAYCFQMAGLSNRPKSELGPDLLSNEEIALKFDNRIKFVGLIMWVVDLGGDETYKRQMIAQKLAET